MDARALVCDAEGTVALRDVELPDPGPDDLAIRTLYSGVSTGTERNLLRGDVSWGPFPICTGYQAVGVVEEVGENVEGFPAGERVYYRDNAGAELPDGTAVSPTSGTHCSAAVIDPEDSHGVGHLPEGADPAAASGFVMPAVGLNGVNMAGVGMGDTVAVQGVGLIGLGVVAAAHRRGAEVVAIDLRADRLEVAKTFGADHLIDAGEGDTNEALREIVPDGADAVFEATGNPDLIDDAMALARRHGTFVFQGDYGDRDVSFYFREPHHKRLTAHFPCDDGLEPGRRAVLAQLASGALPWGNAITHEVAPGAAPALYADVLAGDPEPLGAVVDWT